MPYSPEFCKSLSACLGEVTNPPRNATNPHLKNKYTDLPTLLTHVRPVIARHGFSLFQSVESLEEGGHVVKTVLLGSTGESIESIVPLLSKDQTAQSMGSAITYARRYAILGLLGVAGDDDDDGNRASMEPKQVAQAQKASGSKAADLPILEVMKASPTQVGKFEKECQEMGLDWRVAKECIQEDCPNAKWADRAEVLEDIKHRMGKEEAS